MAKKSKARKRQLYKRTKQRAKERIAKQQKQIRAERLTKTVERIINITEQRREVNKVKRKPKLGSAEHYRKMRMEHIMRKQNAIPKIIDALNIISMDLSSAIRELDPKTINALDIKTPAGKHFEIGDFYQYDYVEIAYEPLDLLTTYIEGANDLITQLVMLNSERANRAIRIIDNSITEIKGMGINNLTFKLKEDEVPRYKKREIDFQKSSNRERERVLIELGLME